MTIDGINGATPAKVQTKDKLYRGEKTKVDDKTIRFTTDKKVADLDSPIKGFELERNPNTGKPIKTEDQSTEYKVKDGDSPWKIAKQMLIDAGEKPTNSEIARITKKIIEENNLGTMKKPKPIHAGDKIKLPPMGEKEPAEKADKKPAEEADKKPEEKAEPKPGENSDKKPPVLGDKPIEKPKPPVAKPIAKPTPKKELTPKERSEARHYGDNVSDYLVGYTTDAEQGLTKEVINKHVNNRNVMDFLAGYEKNKGLGDHFFTQLRGESDFPEKQNLMKNVATKLSQYLKANGQPNLAREIDVALADHGISASETAKLDQIVQTMLTTVPGLKV